MTPDEINRAIAEHLGWKNVHVYEDDAGPPIHCGTPPGPIPYDAVIPRYSEDLNAMREAEKTAFKSSTLWLEFACNILSVLEAADMSVTDGMTCVLQATAAQRAEAFLRTVGKWRDE